VRSDRPRGLLLDAGASRAAFIPANRPVMYSQEEVDDAYARGFVAGTADAQADLRRACSDIADGLASARDTIVAELRRIDASRRDEIVEFAFEVARWLMQAEIEIDPGKVLARLESALPDRRDDVAVRVAPALVDVVRAAAPEVKVIGDAGLSPGDVVITGPNAQLEGTIDDALERLRTYLRADDDGAVR
jgi:flagellar biosynthesis/type III secretory pathway protein FliH